MQWKKPCGAYAAAYSGFHGEKHRSGIDFGRIWGILGVFLLKTDGKFAFTCRFSKFSVL